MKYATILGIGLVLLPAAANAQVSATVTVDSQGTANAPPPPPPPPVMVAPPAGPQPVYVQPAPVYGQPVYGQPGPVVYGQPGPVYGQPAPVYGQPGPVYAPGPYAPGYGPRFRHRITVEYNGGPIPPGAIVRTRHLWGLAAAGIGVFGVSYFVSLLGALVCTGGGCGSAATDFLFIPVAGPFLMLGSPMNDSARALAIFDGVLQTVGLVGAILGFAVTHQTLTYYGSNDSPRRRSTRPAVALLPVAPGTLAGMSLTVAGF